LTPIRACARNSPDRAHARREAPTRRRRGVLSRRSWVANPTSIRRPPSRRRSAPPSLHVGHHEGAQGSPQQQRAPHDARWGAARACAASHRTTPYTAHAALSRERAGPRTGPACRPAEPWRWHAASARRFPERRAAASRNDVQLRGNTLAYIMDTTEKPDDADNPLRLAYGNEAPRQFIEAFAKRFACRSSTATAPARSEWDSRASRETRRAASGGPRE